MSKHFKILICCVSAVVSLNLVSCVSSTHEQCAVGNPETYPIEPVIFKNHKFKNYKVKKQNQNFIEESFATHSETMTITQSGCTQHTFEYRVSFVDPKKANPENMVQALEKITKHSNELQDDILKLYKSIYKIFELGSVDSCDDDASCSIEKPNESTVVFTYDFPV